MVARHATNLPANQSAKLPWLLDPKPPTSPNKTTPENAQHAQR
jgi:hypothetical protein